MAIYDKAGSSLAAAYDREGNGLQNAYDLTGSLVWSTAAPDYSNYSYTVLWTNAMDSSLAKQGFDIYDNKVYWANKTGDDSDDCKIYVLNLTDGSYALPSPYYFTAYGGHANNVTFAHQKYDPSDDLPLVLMTTAYADRNAFQNRWKNDNTAVLTCEYKIPLDATYCRDGYDLCYGSTDDIVYSASMFPGGQDPLTGTHTGIAKFDFSHLTDNGDGTYSPTFVSGVTTTWWIWKQGLKYHNGLLWLPQGANNSGSYVHAIDPDTGTVRFTIDCETTVEIEGCAWYPDANAIGGYALYVGFQGGTMRKYTFSAI